MGRPGTGSWVTPTGCAAGDYPLFGQVTQTPNPVCVGTWLRVEYLNNAGVWVGVTQEWLRYGFGRGYGQPPTAPWGSGGGVCTPGATPAGQCYNPISPAILILQQLQSGQNVNAATGTNRDRRGTGCPSTSTTRVKANHGIRAPAVLPGLVVRWRHERRSNSMWATSGSGCSVKDPMLAVVVLWSTIRKTTATFCTSPIVGECSPIANAAGNGLYNRITGMSGLEDTVNAASATGVPDNNLEGRVYYTYSPEDLNADNRVDNWGGKYLGAGFGLQCRGDMSHLLHPGNSGIATVRRRRLGT